MLTPEAHLDEPDADRGRPPRRLALRIVRWTLLLTLLAVVVIAGWTAYCLAQTRTDLTQARTSLSTALAAAQRGDQSTFDRALASAAESSSRSTDSADSGPLPYLADIRWVGDPIRSVRDIAAVVDLVANEVARPGADAATALTGKPLLVGGAVDTAAIVAARDPLLRAQTAADDALRRAGTIDLHTWLPQVNAAGVDLVAEIRRLQTTVQNARVATDLLPDLAGATGRRTYLVALQNNAESRSTGGLVGGFLMFTADRGRIVAGRVVKDLALPPADPIDLGRDYTDLYGASDPTQIWQNSNLSPHFPYAARIWRSLGRQLTGVTADVVVGIDPVGIADILEATGPIVIPGGQVVTSENVVELTESAAYARFSDDRADRKAYLGTIADATFDRIVSGRFDLAQLGKAFAAAVDDSRIAMWSARPAEQARLAATALGHEVPYSPGPYANVVVNNSYASKLDFYLQRDIRYRYGICSDGRQRVRVDVTLTNGVRPAVIPQLSPEVLGTFLPSPDRLPRGTNRVTVSVYSSWGSTLTGITVDGAPTGFGSGVELGHPVHYALVTLAPGTPVHLEFEYSEPYSSAAPDIPIQPLANPPRFLRSGAQCSR